MTRIDEKQKTFDTTEPDEPRRVRPGDEFDPDEKELAAFEALRERMEREAKAEKPKVKR